jgi:Cu+-exporting ATPase
MLTGEALPMPKHPGAQVLGGTVNGHGRLVFRVSRVAADTALARMIQLVRQANETRPALARVAERLNFLLGPGAVLLACGVVIGCSLGFPGADFDAVLRRAAAVLLAACPAALALAVPTALSASLGRAARLGILIRSGGTLEACYRLKAVIFDRTGTLTLGRPEVLAVVPAPGKEEAKVLALAAGASAGSDYSLDLAVLAAARAEGIGPVKLADTGRIPGRGRCGRLEGHEALLGSRRLMDERGVYLGDLASAGDEQEAGGYKVQFFSVEGTAEGMLVFEDPLKPGARHTVERVREMGIATGMMTGDGAAPARAAAAAAGMGDGPVIADVRPEDRPMKIREVRESVGETAMIGDAVADGPALAEADVGIALGCGAHVDVETADVVLVGEDLRGVLRALRIARRTMRTMRRNIAWAITFNAVVLPLAAFGLLPPLHAAVVMVLASLLVVTNSHQLSLRPGRLISLGSLEP